MQNAPEETFRRLLEPLPAKDMDTVAELLSSLRPEATR